LFSILQYDKSQPQLHSTHVHTQATRYDNKSLTRT